MALFSFKKDQHTVWTILFKIIEVSLIISGLIPMSADSLIQVLLNTGQYTSTRSYSTYKKIRFVLVYFIIHSKDLLISLTKS